MKVVMERLTYNAYSSMVMSLYEKDQFTFSLLLALEVCTKLANYLKDSNITWK